ncbi:DUF1254 domain-containing protein [Rhabdaerophilum sp. SD176]|uniref:DUF1254 domain-containing protein n=1 Tax=Rhabdaerophilum sp. SD176 TaxID=2983548 RepID=UPI0024E03838|nr:DUF1254 domain-containing protein [Rhabdaerophilum sp. SD176]
MPVSLLALVFVLMATLAHIISLFILPFGTKDDVFSRLERGAATNMIALIEAEDLKGLPFVDPAVAMAVCHYDLSAGPVRLRVPLSETFLSISLAERHRGIYASVSDRAATGGSLDLVVATQAQLDRITLLDDEEQAIEEIRMPARHLTGLAILKVFVDRPSSRARAQEVLRAARCESERLPD